ILHDASSTSRPPSRIPREANVKQRLAFLRPALDLRQLWILLQRFLDNFRIPQNQGNVETGICNLWIRGKNFHCTLPIRNSSINERINQSLKIQARFFNESLEPRPTAESLLACDRKLRIMQSQRRSSFGLCPRCRLAQ